MQGTGGRDRVLLIDDEEGIRRLLTAQLAEAGFSVEEAENGAVARERIRGVLPTAVILDLNLPDIQGTTLLDEFRTLAPDLPVIVLTGEGHLGVAVECMRRGAFDFVVKPHDAERLVATVSNAIEQRRLRSRLDSVARRVRAECGFATILGASPAMRQCLALLSKAADSEVPLLIQGESGTGKEIAARAVHAEGPRRTASFVPINCGAIPEGLIESTLFGHARGAFTGAQAGHVGVFEQADGGTLFLDEIGDLRVDLQVRLLRALQEGEVVPVGGRTPRKVDVRIMAATHRDLRGAVGAGTFREDLYYRLAVFPVELPPLRERNGDIDVLAETFLAKFCERHRRPPKRLSAAARQAMARYRWPGNVRELQNVLERACILEEGVEITLGSLPDPILDAVDPSAPARPAEPGEEVSPPPPPEAPEPPAAGVAEGNRPLESLEEVERRHLLRGLRESGWRVREAAAALGVSRATLYRKIERFGLSPDSPGD